MTTRGLRNAFLAAALAATQLACIKLDFFLFDTAPAESVATDYHGLPLYQDTAAAPAWTRNVAVEREVYLDAADGGVIAADQLASHESYIHGVFIPAPAACPADICPLAGRNVTFLYCHGNSGDLFTYWYRGVALWTMGANVFIFTYRGYGMSKGEASRASILQDVDAAAAYVRGRADVDTSTIIVYGYSMGGVPASYLAGASARFKNRFAGIVIEAGLDSAEHAIALSTGTDFPAGFFLEDTEFNGPDFIRNTTMPILHIHGGRDNRVITDQALSYYEALKSHANYSYRIGSMSNLDAAWDAPWLEGAGHRTIPAHAFVPDIKISDYWDDPENPNHCCVNPLEYGDPQFASFLQSVGGTTSDAMLSSAGDYRALVTAWVVSILP